MADNSWDAMRPEPEGWRKFTGDKDLATELIRRYQTTSMKDAASRFGEEIGLGPVPPPIEQVAHMQDPRDLGVFTYMQGTRPGESESIQVRQDLSPEEKISTVAHELAHAADRKAFNFERMGGSTHHKYFQDFEPEMAAVMREQSRIEEGHAPSPQMQGNYPYLKEVRPLSSNRLASPWSFTR